MSTPAAFALPPSANAQMAFAKGSLAKPAVASGATPAQLKALAGKFESTFISSTLQPMFSSLSTAAPFGGGQGEEAFRSFLVDAVAKQMTKSGGLGLSTSLQREFVRMQSGHR